MDGAPGSTGRSVGGGGEGSKSKINQTQEQVEEVVGIMRVNIEKVLQRDEKLSELSDRADALNMGANNFEQQAMKLKRKMWWRNLKFTLILGGIIAVFVIIMISKVLSSNNENPNKT